MADVCAAAEAADTDAARMDAYGQLRSIVSWLVVPLDDPDAYPELG